MFRKILRFITLVFLLLLLAGAVSWSYGRVKLIALLNDDDQPGAHSQIENLGTTQTLTITPLVEADALPGFQAVHGVSYRIQTDDFALLMDTGSQESAKPHPLENNLQALKLSPTDFDTLVISHNHFDHVGGLSPWFYGTFTLGTIQPDLSGKTLLVPTDLDYPGARPDTAVQPQRIAAGVGTTGTLPFAQVFPFSLLKGWDYEQAVVVNLEKHGLIVITGCGHPGIQRIVTRAEWIYGQPVIGVIGGLHYGSQNSDKLQADMDFLRERSIQVIALSPHDSGPEPLRIVQEAFPDNYREIKVGQSITLGKY